MKKLTVTLMVLSLIAVIGCGKDKKKKNNNMVISGISNIQNCQPQVTSGHQLDTSLQQQIMQQCYTWVQTNQQIIQQKRMSGQQIYFSVPVIQNPYAANPYMNPAQGNFYQQPYGPQYPNQAGMGMYQIAPGSVISFY